MQIALTFNQFLNIIIGINGDLLNLQVIYNIVVPLTPNLSEVNCSFASLTLDSKYLHGC